RRRRAHQHPGPRRGGDAVGSGPDPGAARDAPRGDAGQRAGRHGVCPRGPRRRIAGPGRRERALSRDRGTGRRSRPGGARPGSGPGGVGRTTAAAAIALEGARRGRRAVVVTIDPAKRLADALGLSGGLTNVPSEIAGPWPGQLWAVMLDTKSTFDAVVTRYAIDQTQAERILANRFYRNISGALSGTQEYMAAEKLYE